MAWNDGKERKKFEAQQEKFRKIYLENGMSEEQIQALYEFDKGEFKSRRRYSIHTQRLDFDSIEFDDKETDNPLFEKFLEALSITDEYMSEDRFGWVEEIADARILKAVKSLSIEQLELVTMLAFDDMNQTEISEVFGVSQQSISKKIKKIKEIFQKWL